MPNTRLLSAIGLVVLFVVGLLVAFFPFQRASSEMETFCAGLDAGLSMAEVRTRARADGYRVDYERFFMPPKPKVRDGGLDGGDDDAGELLDAGAASTDAGVAVALGDGGQAWLPLPGSYLVFDPQFERMTCQLRFDDHGRLASSRFSRE